jgi:predicted dehydrogenase
MVNIGFIGCGGIARHHLSRLKTLPNAKVVGAMDANPEAAAKFAADAGGARPTSDLKELLRMKEIAAVYVCTPTGLHVEGVVAAAKAKKHVFCEKPIAMKASDARKMINACAKAGVKFQMGFVRRYCTHWGKVKEQILNGVIGRPILWRSVAGGAGPASKWFLDRQIGGGPLLDGAVHDYDFLRSMFGDGRLTMGSMKTFKPDTTALDSGSALVRFASGDECMMSWSWGLPKGVSTAHHHDVIGPKGAIFFSAPADKIPAGTDLTKFGAIRILLEGGVEKIELFEKRDMFVEQAKHFLDCVENDREPCVGGEAGLKALEIWLGIYKSCESGKAVALK